VSPTTDSLLARGWRPAPTIDQLPNFHGAWEHDLWSQLPASVGGRETTGWGEGSIRWTTPCANAIAIASDCLAERALIIPRDQIQGQLELWRMLEDL
jgi:hypothetical protein